MNSSALSVIAFDLPLARFLPAEADATVVTREQTAVADRDAMSATPEIVEDVLWSGEGRLAQTIHATSRSACKWSANAAGSIVQRSLPPLALDVEQHPAAVDWAAARPPAARSGRDPGLVNGGERA